MSFTGRPGQWTENSGWLYWRTFTQTHPFTYLHILRTCYALFKTEEESFLMRVCNLPFRPMTISENVNIKLITMHTHHANGSPASILWAICLVAKQSYGRGNQQVVCLRQTVGKLRSQPYALQYEITLWEQQKWWTKKNKKKTNARATGKLCVY